MNIRNLPINIYSYCQNQLICTCDRLKMVDIGRALQKIVESQGFSLV